MEVHKRFLTILTPQGEFLRARNLKENYQIGQEIDFFPIEQRKISKRLSFSLFQPYKGKLVVSTALALMLLMISILPFKQNNQVYAYLSIDINPSLELGVNKNCQVIELIPYNEDGEKIVSLLHDWEKKDIEDVTSEIMDVIQSQGYLKENHEVILSTVYVNTDMQDRNKHIEKEIEQEMDKVKEIVQQEDLEVTVVIGTQKDRKEAMEKGLTTGLYKEINKNTNKKETKEEKKEIEIPIQQNERPQQSNSAIHQNERPQQSNPAIHQKERPQQGNPAIHQKEQSQQGNPAIHQKEQSQQGNPAIHQKEQSQQGNPAIHQKEQSQQGNSTIQQKERPQQGNSTIQQKERPQQGNPTIQQKERPQQGNPTIQQKKQVEDQPIKPKEKVNTVKESTPSIPPGQKKKEDKSIENFRETEKIKIEDPIEKEDHEKPNNSMESKEDKPKQWNKENQGKIVEHDKESNMESKSK